MQDEPELGAATVHDGRMKTIMNSSKLETIEPVREFLSGTEAWSSRSSPVIAIRLDHPITDRLCRRLELPSQRFRGTSRSNQLDHLPPKLRRICTSSFRHRGLPPSQKMRCPRNGVNSTRFLKPSITFEHLDALAMQMSDNETAAQLHKARQQLFKQIHEQSSHRPGSRTPSAIPGGQYSFTLGGQGFTTFFQTHL